jgi:5,10-methylenetetrahydrofolate reductase
MSLKDAFDSGKFVITAEIAPPKGTDVGGVIRSAYRLKGWVDACNVTDQQSAVMRLGSLTTCNLIKVAGVEPIFQLTCRDRNRIALQSDLLSAAVMGIENILAITGDLPELGDHPQAKPVYDLDSVQLLKVIQTLNKGNDMVGNDLQGNTSFFAGAAVCPCCDTEAKLAMQLIKMEKKIQAGAHFFQTQAVYDIEELDRFINKSNGFNVPIMAGIVPLKSASMARYMNKNVAGVNVPEILITRMADSPDPAQEGIKIAAELIKEARDICQGVHIMAIGWENKVPIIIDAAGL